KEPAPTKVFDMGMVKHQAPQIKKDGIQINSGDIFQSSFSEPDQQMQKEVSYIDTTAAKEPVSQTISQPIGAGQDTITPIPEVLNGKHVRYVDSSYLDMRNHPYYPSF